MDLPEEAKRAPSAPVWNQSLPSPRRICLKRLSELYLPRFGIRVFLLLRHCLSAAPSLSGATLLSILEGVPLSATWGNATNGPMCIVNIFCLHLFLYLLVSCAWWDWPWPGWLTIVLQCYDALGWVMWPIKSSPKWPIMCQVGHTLLCWCGVVMCLLLWLLDSPLLQLSHEHNSHWSMCSHVLTDETQFWVFSSQELHTSALTGPSNDHCGVSTSVVGHFSLWPDNSALHSFFGIFTYAKAEVMQLARFLCHTVCLCAGLLQK